MSGNNTTVSNKEKTKMADEKKLTKEEITDEQANEAAGGVAIRAVYFKCDGCGKEYKNDFCNSLSGKLYCTSCYSLIRTKRARP